MCKHESIDVYMMPCKTWMMRCEGFFSAQKLLEGDGCAPKNVGKGKGVSKRVTLGREGSLFKKNNYKED